ncbi:gamma-glutamyltransferase [Flammeovirgaceae bacterium SG7u.111]|nr:gamma-glutamyltransferase [Flammeovirgaceae bacterium SG7u.132]WPO33179.1 gamma-glutamyltransferase [Flammeovirgaceae bacterium SG7u.111]
MKAKLILVLAFLLTFLSCQEKATKEEERVVGVLGQNGMVASAHPIASEVGLEILKKGGNAYDAAIAVQFALAVVYPGAGNIGGGGFLVYRKSDGEIGALDYREKAPGSAGRDMYLDENGEVIKGKSTRGHLAAGVPGSVDGMFKIHEKLGSLPMEELLQPAIDLAANGFLLTEREAGKLNRTKETFLETNTVAPTNLISDSVWHENDTIYYKDLAATLTRIKENGRDGFYAGETAKLIVEEMERGGGIMTEEDLAAYSAVWREPVTGVYKGHKVISMSPPSSGGVALMQLLKGIEPFDIKGWGHNSAQTVHTMVEIERRVYADRATHLGDADFYDVPLEGLLADNYIQGRMSDIDPDKKTSSEDVVAGDVVPLPESLETTHFSVVDKEGNAASITTTLNGGFGCKVVVAGAGFFLNNEMDDFSVKPGHPNMFGLVGGEANAIQPGKRMLSSMTPTIIEKDGKLLMVVGTPGGSTIITSVYQTILNVLDHGMTMQEAVNAQKFHSQWLPDMVFHEPTAFDSTTVSQLTGMGHELKERSSLGRMDCILVWPDGSLEGASDFTRADNTSVGY